ncbi:unnamed protein product [Cyclocybe aegerita]|uniref:Intradiol ring-cleavage dioxygenases domain-containing protein n=1 Tax=Cyclocybe aegerita TaxID=1973307 RepID=A0A8S0XWX8_CYCAE|nr:unnamed protein product [Cyclocybe aegerita]
MHLSLFASFIVLGSLVAAHPGGHAELVNRAQHEARALQARKCAPAIAEFERVRRERRELRMGRRQEPSTTATAPNPHYSTIQNSTCVTAPEVIEGPYYIGNEYIRYDLRETQPGQTLVLDIGVIDTTTCEPFVNAFVELWNANATGAYGGYEGGDVKKDTFLRGGHFTNDQGIIELTTIYPGFYRGRTAHIHTMIHKDSEQQANGTIISSSGTLTHIGQFFFEESWNDAVYATDPYTANTQERTLNSEDMWIEMAGDGAFVNLENLGSSLDEGLLGYITVAVDGNATYTYENQNTL